ncbi:MAG: phosphotransferase family protein [Gemmatimonadaceae bacterium]|jgi:aminoglycoside phosphotransferase (APT) family kinase protein|nr:phosphotransferase family protein [Gemmatimonadaceae bacterium]
MRQRTVSDPAWLDSTRAPRDEEAIDATALAAWMREAVPEALGDGAATLAVTQFGGGFSNLTYLVRGGVRELVLRRPPRGAGAGPAHDMAREVRVLRAVWPITHQVPEPIAYCDDATVLGAPFYLMSRVRGVILRDRPPEGVSLDAVTMHRLCDAFVQGMAALHTIDVHATGLASLGRADGYVPRQVDGWTRRWEAARTVDVPDMDALAAWLASHQPVVNGGAPSALIHNDYKFDNLVLDPDDLTQVRAVLDWEMATIGDPLMDLGTTLAYWTEADDPPLFRALGLGITAQPGAWTRAELIGAYARITGRDVAAMRFYSAFGRFKLAVVAQQLHARFVRGASADPRFARLDAVVQVLAAQGLSGV